ncbi:tryptophan synthase subunit alpha [Oceanobacillus piezotolerans]|uniref:Tryptophan synthase alpha chain n=1 Tax=Oceanobacillus piezotolerans TaxID=2448030 RepID=A0A498D2Y8_9BACI|nr:tryptophan synthase subunit alpha [Oceanobacillus piezotolerans]RLL42043.1 tryptophan synthase subunit alpha [Oceanobacillus piezotolerans]
MGKNRIDSIFKSKLAADENLFVPYIMAGDGGLDKLKDRIHFLTDSGVSAIELGIPFSDPVADGPTIQAAGQRALKAGTTLKGVLEVLATFKEERSVPIILMTYVNPIFIYGIEEFTDACVTSGVDGVIIPDLPMEEEDLVRDALQKREIAFIRLAAMTSPEERMKEIASRSEGFLYAVSVMGTTGARKAHSEEVKSYLETLKKHSPVPVLAGFGVSSVEQAHELSASCDGVIVGSKIVDLLHESKDDEVRTLIEGSVKKENVRL